MGGTMFWGTGNLGNGLNPFTLETSGACAAKSTDCAPELGMGARTLLGGDAEIVFHSVPKSCCSPLDKLLHHLWSQDALDAMCNACNATQNAVIKQFYAPGSTCSAPETVSFVTV